MCCLPARRISSSDPPALGTIEAAAAAVTHLQRIIDTKHAVLLKSRDSTDRSCLHGMVQWLFEQAGQPETQYRRKCMQLFSALAPRVMPSTSGTGDEPAKQWVARFTASAGMDVLVSIIEPYATAALPPPLSDTGEDSLNKVCPFFVSCTVGYLSFGPIEKYCAFCDLSVREKAWCGKPGI